MKTHNKPYVKNYDKDGNLLNPITKNKPYLFAPISNFKFGFRHWRKSVNKYFTGRIIAE